MAKIKKSDLVEEKLLEGFRQELDLTLKKMNEFSAAMESHIKTQSKVAQNAKNTAKGFREVAQAEEESKRALVEKEKMDNRIIQTQQKLTQVNRLQRERLAALSVEEQRRNKSAKESAKLANQNIGAFERLGVQIKMLSDKYRDLVIQEGKETKQSKALRQEILKLKDARNKANESLGNHQHKVGQYGKAVSKVTGLLRGFGGAMIAAFSFQAVKSFFSSSIDAFRTQEKAIAKVNQAIESTGGAANRTSEQLQKMASDLQKETLFGDEEILNNVTAQLLTFTNIAGNQFDRTQKVALDLATVLDGDLKSASIQLGKALNDPIHNLSALSRSGIQFSDSQKDVIKSLAESGKLAEAQNVILTELERQYGGQAKAAAEVDGGITQMKNAYGDFKEMVGKVLMEGLKPTIKALKEFFENIKEEQVKRFIKTISMLFKTFLAGVGIMKTYQLAVKGATALNNAFGKTIIKNVKGMGLYAAAAVAVVWALMDIWKQYKKIETAGETMNRINEKTNDILAEEKDKLQLLGKELLANRDNMEKRQEIIDEINANYGTTLQNLEDETAMVKQLTEAYQDIVKSLRQKIKLELVEEEIKDKSKRLLELQKETEGLGEVKTAFKLATDPQFILRLKEQEELQNSINELEAEYLGLKKQDVDLNKPLNQSTDLAGGIESDAKKAEDVLAKFRKEQLLQRQEYEAALIREGIPLEMREQMLFEQRRSQYNDELNFIKSLGEEYRDELIKTRLEAEKFREDGYFIPKFDKSEIEKIEKEAEKAGSAFADAFTNAMIEANKKIAEKNKQQIDEIVKATRKGLVTAMQAIEQHYARRIQLIENEIEAKKQEVQESKDREDELKQIAKERGLDADESINEERERQKRALAEQQDLERKKQRAEALIAALQLLAAKVEAGEGNPVQNIKNQINSLTGFIKGAFYKGTKTTLGDEVGYTGRKDSHLILADENEAIFNPKQTAALGIGKGGNTTDDIVRIYKNSIQSDAMASRKVSGAKNRIAEGLVGKKLDKLIEVSQKRMPDVGKMAYDTITEAFIYQTGRQKYIYPKSKRR